MKHTILLLALAGASACTLGACSRENASTDAHAAAPITAAGTGPADSARPRDAVRTPVTPPTPVLTDPGDIDTRPTDPVGTDATIVDSQKVVDAQKDEDLGTSGTSDALLPPGLPPQQTPDGNTPPTDPQLGATAGNTPGASAKPGSKDSKDSKGAKDETARVGPADAEFLTKAANGGLFEVESGELAVLQATTPFVRDFAQMMVVDHGDANRDLEALAREKGLQFPKALDEESERRLNTLREQKGVDFDRQYRDMQVTAHKDAIALYEKASTECEDADLKAFASKMLPALREHQRRLNEMPPTEGS